MERYIQKELIKWVNKKNRLPLIIQGARQVGKTYCMKWLGENQFKNFVYFNFDERPELKEFFKLNKDVDRITQNLSLVSGVRIDNSTLVIFDEIQECPEALNVLKYFAEKKSEIPIICAGSLLGLLLNAGHSFPVGKVEFLTLYPMTFREVLPYWNKNLSTYVEAIESLEPIPQLFYNDLLENYKKYLITGGLPAVINSLSIENTFEACDSTLDNIIKSYKGDFAKHPITNDIGKITQVFDSLPSQLARENKKFVYQLVRTGARAREYEDAIQWLINTGMVYKIPLITKPNLPVSAYQDLNVFKLYSFDIGILRKLSKLSYSIFAEGNKLFTEFKGAFSENCVLQSLITQFGELLCYWTSGNTAEVDFVLQYINELIPVEVKSDENIKSRSLQLYQQKFNPTLRIRYSLKNLKFQDGMLNIPLFLTDYTKKMIQITQSQTN